MYCQQCGQLNEDAAVVCVKCGARMTPAVAAPAAAVSAVYAGFWKRCAAFIIDYLIVIVLAMVSGVIIGFVYGAVSDTTSGAELLGGLAGLAVWWLYHAMMESSARQATLGKMALGIRVADQRGARLSFGRASGRHFAKLLSGMIFAIGYLMAGFTAKKQALHDMIAGCLVINAGVTEAQLQSSAPAAGMPWWAIVLIVMGAMVVPVGILAAIAIPAYQDFNLRSKIAVAMQTGNEAKSAVTAYYVDNKKLPPDAKAAGIGSPTTPYVKSVTLDAATGAIRVVLAIPTLDGKSILYVPRTDDQDFRWTCRSDDVPARYLPSYCRPGADAR